MLAPRMRLIFQTLLLGVFCAFSMAAQDANQLSEQAMRDFLVNAKVVSSKSTKKGITGVHRLTLSDGTLTHDASFQSIDEAKPKMQFEDGRTEVNFRDSYKFNIAAYELAKLLGLSDMMPVTVERSWGGEVGSLSWWLPVMIDEEQRLKKKIEPPVPEDWNKQMHKMRVFSQLVYDTDRNLGNVLISENWHLWMIDFSRAFRIYPYLQNEKNLEKCDRKLLEALRQLKVSDVEKVTKKWLTKMEINAIMARRDKIIALFEKLAAKKGEAEVFYN